MISKRIEKHVQEMVNSVQTLNQTGNNKMNQDLVTVAIQFSEKISKLLQHVKSFNDITSSSSANIFENSFNSVKKEPDKAGSTTTQSQVSKPSSLFTNRFALSNVKHENLFQKEALSFTQTDTTSLKNSNLFSLKTSQPALVVKQLPTKELTQISLIKVPPRILEIQSQKEPALDPTLLHNIEVFGINLHIEYNRRKHQNPRKNNLKN